MKTAAVLKNFRKSIWMFGLFLVILCGEFIIPAEAGTDMLIGKILGILATTAIYFIFAVTNVNKEFSKLERLKLETVWMTVMGYVPVRIKKKS